MRARKLSWAIRLTILVVAVAGAWLFRVRSVKASPQSNGEVAVLIHSVVIPSLRGSHSYVLPGMKVVGISCISRPSSNMPEATECYVATSAGE